MEVETFVVKPVPQPSGCPLDTPAGMLAEAMYQAEERAQAELDADVEDDDWPNRLAFSNDPPVTLSIRDEAGRPFTAARLDREPGTDRFIVTLLTTTEATL